MGSPACGVFVGIICPGVKVTFPCEFAQRVGVSKPICVIWLTRYTTCTKFLHASICSMRLASDSMWRPRKHGQLEWQLCHPGNSHLWGEIIKSLHNLFCLELMAQHWWRHWCDTVHWSAPALGFHKYWLPWSPLRHEPVNDCVKVKVTIGLFYIGRIL